MNKDNGNGLQDTLRVGSSTASFVKSAVKTGKTLSGAAKGAAAGPYGAVAGVLWENRKTVAGILLGMTVFMLIPLLLLTMLPSLIFGGVGEAHSEKDPDRPVLNSATATAENMNEIVFSVNSLIGEGRADAESRIATDFAASGADRMETANPYADNPVLNVNRFIGNYCAFRNGDPKNISLSDMESILKNGKTHIFSFTVKTETRPKEGEEGTDTWKIYTLVYNGEEYFADTIFNLTPEQKELADDYAENVSLLFYDGIIQNNAEWNGRIIAALGDVTFTDCTVPVVYYSQLDERYASEPYGTDKVGGHGCGPTCMAMVVSSLGNTEVDPVRMAEWSYLNGYWCKKSGSYHALIPAAAEAWGLPVSGCSALEPQRITDALNSGKLVVAIMSRGHFTKGGHFIVLRGISGGKVLVADPASLKRSGKEWDLSIILKEASRGAAAGGPFWIIG